MKTAEQLDTEIAILDRDIEGRLRRLSDLRQHRDRLYRDRLALDTPLDSFEQRDSAVLVKPRGRCVTIDGWDV
jgi:hypothetical protein